MSKEQKKKGEIVVLPGLQGTSLDVLLASMLNPEMVIASVQPIESLHALADLVRERKGKLTAADCVAHACRFPRVVHPDSVRGLVYQLYKAKQKGHKGVMLQSGLVKPGVVTPTMTVNFLSDIEGQATPADAQHLAADDGFYGYFETDAKAQIKMIKIVSCRTKPHVNLFARLESYFKTQPLADLKAINGVVANSSMSPAFVQKLHKEMLLIWITNHKVLNDNKTVLVAVVSDFDMTLELSWISNEGKIVKIGESAKAFRPALAKEGTYTDLSDLKTQASAVANNPPSVMNCAVCGVKTGQRCPCKKIAYCCKEHQRMDRPKHKASCTFDK